MKRLWLITASVLLGSGMALLGLPGCSDNDTVAVQGTATIGGNVVSFKGGTAGTTLAGLVQGVVVTIVGPVTRTATTDENGIFTFADLPAGEYTMSFQYSGMSVTYLKDGQPALLVVGEGQTVRLVDVVIKDGVASVGNVLMCDPGATCEPPEQPTKLRAPELVSPEDSALVSSLDTNVELDWRAVEGAASYVVEVENGLIKSRIMATVVIPSDYVRYLKRETTDTSYNVSFSANGYFRWRVWALDADRNPGCKSEWRLILVNAR